VARKFPTPDLLRTHSREEKTFLRKLFEDAPSSVNFLDSRDMQGIEGWKRKRDREEEEEGRRNVVARVGRKERHSETCE